jgi:hypothetical protein
MFKYILKFLVVFRQIYRYSIGRTKHYYDGERKIWLHIAIDLIYLLVREGEFCYLYYALGYDQKGVEVSEYIGKKRVFYLKKIADKRLKSGIGQKIDYDVVTKDKFYAGSIIRANGLPAIEDLALISNGKLFIPCKGICELAALTSLGNHLVLKNTVMEASAGVLFVDVNGMDIFVNGIATSYTDLRQKVSTGVWVIQRKQSSHQKIAEVNASSLNVMRVATIFDGKDVMILGGFQAFATGLANTDSWSEGSVYVGVDFEKGCLKKYGIRSPNHESEEGLEAQHPDSRVIFEGYPIPYLGDVKELCIMAHRLFYSNYLLGWDIAILDDGPVIVEVNEKPGMNVLQCSTGGLSSIVKSRIRSIRL